jgi:glutamine cyclotransferase
MFETETTKCLFTIAAVLAFVVTGACSDTAAPPDTIPPDTLIQDYTYNIVATYPHDAGSSTQGLVYVDSVFIEGTGYYYGPATLRRVEVETGTVIDIRDMPDTPPNMFGEGVAVWGDTIVQLTWLVNVAIIYNKDTFAEIGRFSYPTEGWGLTHDGVSFIMSDGTDTLYFRDKDTFAELRRVTVTDDTGAIDQLNELEYIDGLVYANRWYSDIIYVIDPETGRVKERIDLTGLDPANLLRGVLNGIAYDSENDRLFVTGKRWRLLHLIELIEK